MRSKPITGPSDPQAEARDKAEALLEGEASSPGSAPPLGSGDKPKRRYRRRQTVPDAAEETAARKYVNDFLALSSRLFAVPAEEKVSAEALPPGLRQPTLDERIGAAAQMVAFSGQALALKYALLLGEYREEAGFGVALTAWLTLLGYKHVPTALRSLGSAWRGEPVPAAVAARISQPPTNGSGA